MVRTARRPSPFLLAGYVAPWVEHLAAPGAPLLLAAERAGRIVGGPPLGVHPSGGARRLVVPRAGGAELAQWGGGVEATPADLLLTADAPAGTAAALAAAAEA